MWQKCQLSRPRTCLPRPFLRKNQSRRDNLNRLHRPLRNRRCSHPRRNQPSHRECDKPIRSESPPRHRPVKCLLLLHAKGRPLQHPSISNHQAQTYLPCQSRTVSLLPMSVKDEHLVNSLVRLSRRVCAHVSYPSLQGGAVMFGTGELLYPKLGAVIFTSRCCYIRIKAQ